jgi:serine/threonine protein kinase
MVGTTLGHYRIVSLLGKGGMVEVYAADDLQLGRRVAIKVLPSALVSGPADRERLLPASGFSTEKVLDIGMQVADAVSAAHDRGIVHRDLKPGNVLLTQTGQVKILDFSLAKLREPEPGLNAELPTQQLTGEGHIVGTVAYMAPEQAEGKPTDHRSDIFSLGVMLYELATGRRPFVGSDVWIAELTEKR